MKMSKWVASHLGLSAEKPSGTARLESSLAITHFQTVVSWHFSSPKYIVLKYNSESRLKVFSAILRLRVR